MWLFNIDINLFFLLNMLKLKIYSYGICVRDLILGIIFVFFIMRVNDLKFLLKLWIFFINLCIEWVIEFGEGWCDMFDFGFFIFVLYIGLCLFVVFCSNCVFLFLLIDFIVEEYELFFIIFVMFLWLFLKVLFLYMVCFVRLEYVMFLICEELDDVLRGLLFFVYVDLLFFVYYFFW